MSVIIAGQKASAPPTYAQLHEQQCIGCPATTGLAPAGHVTVDGLAWAVVACSDECARKAR